MHDYCKFCFVKLPLLCILMQLMLLQCKHDFCWVCLESWKKHSTATGGYFRCNRYEVVKKVEEQQESLKTEVNCPQTCCILFFACEVKCGLVNDTDFFH